MRTGFFSAAHIFSSSCKVRDEDEITEFSYSELQAATNNFSTQMLLGKGSHIRVYKAILRGRKLIAAVKKSKGYEYNLRATTDENEMEILSRIRNQWLLKLIGFSVDISGEKLIVVQYMPNGTLHDQLHHISKRPLSWRKRVRIALDIAKAIEALHSAIQPVIHRDIKSSNVLLDASMSVRLGDFSLALRGHVDDHRLKCVPPAGTLGYLDPSYLQPGDLSMKIDVFSFGILLLEIISGRNAIDINYSPSTITDWPIPLVKKCNFEAICDQRIGPPADASVARKLAVLASHCVAVDAKRRPEMSKVVKLLREVRVRSWIDNFTRCMRKPDCRECEPCRQLVISDTEGELEALVKDLNAGI